MANPTKPISPTHSRPCKTDAAEPTIPEITINETAVLEQIAIKLRQAYNEGPIDPIHQSLMDADLVADADIAYQIQNINTQHWLAEGRRIVGCKIGLTSQAVQQQLGVNQPDFGVLFADMAVPNGGEAPMSRLLQPKVEAEVAFVLARSIEDSAVTLADLNAAIDYAVPAIEIVDSRIRDWKISLVDTVADNASSALYVIGEQQCQLNDINLKTCGMVMTKNGADVSLGVGAACLGHPLNAVLWLAKTMIEKGRPLLAGDIVLSGALGPMTSVAANDEVKAEVAGLGSVSVTFR